MRWQDDDISELRGDGFEAGSGIAVLMWETAALTVPASLEGSKRRPRPIRKPSAPPPRAQIDFLNLSYCSSKCRRVPARTVRASLLLSSRPISTQLSPPLPQETEPARKGGQTSTARGILTSRPYRNKIFTLRANRAAILWVLLPRCEMKIVMRFDESRIFVPT